MSGSTPPRKDAQEEGPRREYEINLEMWRHYDNLRQEKSKTFLTAQTILIAVSGFVVDSQGLQSPLILAVSLLGFGSSVLWFLLLLRNAGYIRFHRERVEDLEPDTGMHFTTFAKKWSDFNEQLWPRRSAKKTENGSSQETKIEGLLVLLFGSSNWIDRLLALLFVVFWFVLFLV
jgi:hypothetical protein